MNARLALHDNLTAAATRAPDHAAYVSGDAVTTYGELAEAAQRFAASLARLGIQKGDRVAIVLDGRVEYLVALYGALRAGATVVPLCPDTRTDLLCWPLEHCEVSLVVMEGTNARYLSGQAGRLPALRTLVTIGKPIIDEPGRFQIVDWPQMVSDAGNTPDAGARGDDLASIVYTSGTTGRPKGVMLAHKCLVANVRSIVEYLALTSTDTIGMVLPYYYVYGTSVLHTHVAAGATVADLGSMAFPPTVLEGLAKRRCTGFSGVPSTFARLLAVDTLAGTDLSALRYVTQAGAAMSPTLAAELRRRLPHVRVFVMYGQTEASARLAYLPPEDLDRKLGSIGKAIPGVTLAICDGDGNLVATGVQGELVARGDNVMLGYWKDPEQTARVLRPEGLRTGDLARADEEGFIWVVGRESDMIKSGAHRISPQEIEDALYAYPDILECAVVGLPDALLGEKVVAFVIPKAGAPKIHERAVLRHCFERLPRFKMPVEVRVVDSLPRTSSGKLQRSELRRKFGGG